MKTQKKDIPVLLAAALFAVCGIWQLYVLSLLSTAWGLILLAVPYFLVAVVLLRRRKDFFQFCLILAMGLMMLMQSFVLWVFQNNTFNTLIEEVLDTCYATARVFTVCRVILFALVVLDGVDGWKKFRVVTGPLWPVPGAVMLLASLVGTVRIALLYNGGFLSGMAVGLDLLTLLWSSPLEALAVLPLSYWLYARAPEELEPFLRMRAGGYIPEAELEEHRRRLGLQKRKIRRTDAQHNFV